MPEERLVIINLRKELKKARRVKRANVAMRILKEKIQKMFKGFEVKIDKSVNEEIWKRGAKKPVTKIKLKILKEDKKVKVELGK